MHVGDVVRIRDGDVKEWWRVAPRHEADALRRWISEVTPLARALIGRRAGDVVSVEGPGGCAWPVTILSAEVPG